MATVLLSAAGAALGGTLGGSVLGVSSVAIGRAVGATLGRVIDQKLLGSGSRAVETGKIDRFRLSGASEGSPIGQVYGRTRLAGQVIWSTDFLETKTTDRSGGGKGGGGQRVETTTYSYSISIAIAICEGAVSHIGRVWADGQEEDPATLNMRIYKGTKTQAPDPTISAVQGADKTPAFRGTAYVVMEDLQLEPFGNRVPQFSFEVSRPTQDLEKSLPDDMAGAVRAVAMMPGSGEYTLATTPVSYDNGFGDVSTANVRGASRRTDFENSVQALRNQLPRCGSVSLIVSWFADDLRCGQCDLRPLVEQSQTDAPKMPWTVSGQGRSTAGVVPLQNDSPVYGGTPSDQSVVQSIQHMQAKGLDVVFYPFILMTQMAGNTLPDPWSGSAGQPKLPWRGRITTNRAPGVSGSSDGTAAAAGEVDSFFGSAAVGDFTVSGAEVTYTGPLDWGYRRFILHYAHLCAAAGGVDAFCIGSEMRGMTQIRGAGHSFPAVAQMRSLAQDCRAILGPDTKIGYAADWSEYFGYHPQDGSGNVYFHLDPLWSDPDIDFIGIDNYMPLSDWRDEPGHSDEAAGAIYQLDYLMDNVAGGEGYDWYYPTQADRDAQNRVPIDDGAELEPWIFRYKDIRNWWGTYHHNRIDGQRQQYPTDWEPQGKPVWFTELGCAAIDKGTNQPNKFLDPKSSESAIPYYSTGRRDPLIQLQYLRAMYGYWNDAANNPTSNIYGGAMVDMTRAHVWAWDARPYPKFPDLSNVWSDASNYQRGHWITGRATGRGLAEVVGEICERSGLQNYDTSRLFGYVRGYEVPDLADARAALQPLMLAYGFDAVDRNGVLSFFNRSASAAVTLEPEALVYTGDDDDRVLTRERAAEPEVSGRVQVTYVDADGDFELGASEAVFADEEGFSLSQSELRLSLTRAEGQAVADRWLGEARVARETAKFTLPPSKTHLGAGDVVALPEAGGQAIYRIDRAEDAVARQVEAVRVDAGLYHPAPEIAETPSLPVDPQTSGPVFPVFLDLPLLSGDETPHAPHVAVTASEWPGGAAVYRSASGADFTLDSVVSAPATLGRLETELKAGPFGVLDRGNRLTVRLTQGALQGVTRDALLAGANAAAIGDGTPDGWEVLQFENAELVGPQTYELSHLLRGQAGTDALVPATWPQGSTFVLLDQAVQQTNLPSSARGVGQYLRVGPSNRPLDDPMFVELLLSFAGNGLRPYAPVFGKAVSGSAGVDLTWIRRTRLDGDLWGTTDVPLGETEERYLVSVIEGQQLRRSAILDQAQYSYSTAMAAEDGVAGNFEVHVAQISERFGPGPALVIPVTP